MRKILIIDTSILFVYLGVPGKDTCGTDKNKWDNKRVDELLQKEEKESTTFVLPLAAIIETGNHTKSVSITPLFPNEGSGGGGCTTVGGGGEGERLFTKAKKGHTRRIWYHIAQANSKRYEMAQALAEIMEKVADATTPWAAFTHQSELWEAQGLKKLAEEWPKLAVQKISIGDATIKTVAEYYGKIGFRVEILTGDGGLKSYEPTPPFPRPKRRRSG